MASFTKLEVFRRSIDLVQKIYALTELLPSDEKYGLKQQLKRAVVSIPSAIAEGSSRRTANERKHYIDIAIGSLNEVYTQIMIASRLRYLPIKDFKDVEADYEFLRAKLISFQNSMRDRS